MSVEHRVIPEAAAGDAGPDELDTDLVLDSLVRKNHIALTAGTSVRVTVESSPPGGRNVLQTYVVPLAEATQAYLINPGKDLVLGLDYDVRREVIKKRDIALVGLDYDTSDVWKYGLTDEEYHNRRDNYRDYSDASKHIEIIDAWLRTHFLEQHPLDGVRHAEMRRISLGVRVNRPFKARELQARKAAFHVS
jgi:hypothetical protein